MTQVGAVRLKRCCETLLLNWEGDGWVASSALLCYQKTRPPRLLGSLFNVIGMVWFEMAVDQVRSYIWEWVKLYDDDEWWWMMMMMMDDDDYGWWWWWMMMSGGECWWRVFSDEECWVMRKVKSLWEGFKNSIGTRKYFDLTRLKPRVLKKSKFFSLCNMGCCVNYYIDWLIIW